GIAAALRVEDLSQKPHRVEIVGAELPGHEIDFLDTNAVLAGDTAAEFDASREDFVPGGQRAADLAGVAFIVEDQRVEIAVAGVEDVRDAQAVAAAAIGDKAHHL